MESKDPAMLQKTVHYAVNSYSFRKTGDTWAKTTQAPDVKGNWNADTTC